MSKVTSKAFNNLMSEAKDDLKRATNLFVSAAINIFCRVVDSGITAGMGETTRSQSSAPAPAPAPRPRGEKRTPEVMEKLGARFVDHVRSHPGLRIEKINKDLGTTTRDLALPIRKLLGDKTIRTEGQKRSTTYFVIDPKPLGRAKKGARAKSTKSAKPKS